jgi:protein SCO1/2
MTTWRFCFVTLIIAVTVSVAGSATRAQPVIEDPPQLAGVDVVERPGAQIPLDLQFVDESDDTTVIGRYFEQGQPVVLVLAYYTCPMLCNLVMNGLSDAVKEMDWLPGQEFSMLTVSIDPRETSFLAKAKKENYIAYLDRGDLAAGWHFLVGPESQSRQLADAVGFQYRYDEDQQQYAHPAVLTILTEGGVVSRYLYGIEFNPRDLRLALLEASEGKIGNTIDRLILYCYHYDPEAGGYVLFAQNVMRLGGGVTLVLLTGLIGVLLLRERRKRRARTIDPQRTGATTG